jgi:hypothetical protein
MITSSHTITTYSYTEKQTQTENRDRQVINFTSFYRTKGRYVCFYYYSSWVSIVVYIETRQDYYYCSTIIRRVHANVY